MTWGAPSESVKMYDISQYQNWANQHADRKPGRINFKELKRLNPDVRVIIFRLAGAWSGIDDDFEYNYEEAGGAGFDLGVYLNNNPAYSVDYMLNEWWGPAMGSKKPPLITIDAETNGWKDKDGNWHGVFIRSVVTDQLEDIYKAVTAEWSFAEQWTYSGHWWNENTVYRPWMKDLKNWRPHYWRYVWDKSLNGGKGDYRVVYSYEEIEPFLPEKRDYIPDPVNGMIAEQIVAWQITDKAIIQPISSQRNQTPRCDINYLLKSEYERIWGPLAEGGQEQDPPVVIVPPEPVIQPEPVACEPLMRVQVTTSRGLNLRPTPDTTKPSMGALLIGARVPIYAFHDGGPWGMIGDGVWIHTGYTRQI
jgi:hypothetical protein